MPKQEHSNLFRRYIWLVDVIYSAERITFEEINRKWERCSLNEDGGPLPKKTFRRHCSEIESLFEIDIECDRKDGYKYYIENADDIAEGGVRTWLINTFAVKNLINESHQLKRRILFENIPSGQRFLTPIIEAMRDSSTIVVAYQNFRREDPVEIELEPYCVKVFRQRWYLLGKKPGRENLMVYALDRIKSLVKTGRSFKMKAHFDAKGHFSSAYGIIVDEEYDVTRIRFKVTGDQRKYFITLPLHSSQEEIEKGDDYSVFEVYLIPGEDFVMELLSHGPALEVLSPDWLRESMRERAEKMLENYTGTIR